MKKTVALFFVFIMVSCSQKSTFSKEALSEKLITTNNNQITFENILKKYKGKNLLIKIWASWCIDCLRAMPRLHELQTNNPNVAYLFISMDINEDSWKEEITKYSIKGDNFIAIDQMNGKFANAIDLNWIPRYIIVDKTGKIVLYKATESDFEQINTILKKLE